VLLPNPTTSGEGRLALLPMSYVTEALTNNTTVPQPTQAKPVPSHLLDAAAHCN
jgi:hypothetical protein